LRSEDVVGERKKKIAVLDLLNNMNRKPELHLTDE